MTIPVDAATVACLALLLAPLVAVWGADPPPGAPGYVLSREERFATEARPDYVEGTRKWIALMRDSDIGLSFATFADADGNVEYNAPVPRLEDVGRVLRAWARAEGLLDDADWAHRRQGALLWSRYSLWWQSPELTYRPPAPGPADMPYFVWKNLRLRPASEPAFLDAAGRVRALLREEPLDRALGVFRNICGPEGPLYTIVIPGRDPDELKAWLESTWRALGAREPFLIDKLQGTVEEVSEGRGWDMPELSLKKR